MNSVHELDLSGSEEVSGLSNFRKHYLVGRKEVESGRKLGMGNCR